MSDPYVALPCAAALGVNGSYIASFHSPKLFLAHQGWSFAIVTILFTQAVAEPDPDVVLACAYLLVLTLVLFSAPVLTQSLLLLLRRDAATAFFDPLTGLRNRRGLDAAVTAHGDRPGTASVMLIDLDDFKKVNDRFGHAHGDLVLRTTATVIDEFFPPPAITARTGGEEFVVLTDADPTHALDQAQAVTQRLAVHAGAGTTVSIGMVRFDAADLIRRFEYACDAADTAMYAAKRAGGNAVHVSDSVL